MSFREQFLASRQANSFQARFAAAHGLSRKPDLRQQEFELEALRQATGAAEPEQDRPGIFRTVLDVLSRPNFAIAGFAEEILEDTPSVTRGVKRALTEIFSGVGGLQGKKRAFGEVMENLGVGTHTLADAFPSLEDNFIGQMGSRGAAGLALDIFLDPLTYITGGGSAAGRIVAKVGGKNSIRYLNKAGIARRNEVTREVIESLGPDLAAAERKLAKKLFPGDVSKIETKFGSEFAPQDFAVMRAQTTLQREVDRRVLDAVSDSSGELLQEFTDKGGVKIFGKTLIPSRTLRGFYAPVVGAARATESGRAMLDGARKMSDGMKAGINQMFHPFNELGNLPAGDLAIAKQLRRDFQNASAVHRGRLLEQAKDIEKVYRKLEKSDPLIGKKWYDIREGVRPNDLVGDELDAYNATMALYDSMGRTLLEHGVLDANQIRKGYIFHGYKKGTLDDLRAYHWNDERPFSGTLSEQFTKERAFDAFDDSVAESRRLNAISAEQGLARQYPILEPEYDVFENMGRYIHAHSESLARKSWREEAAARFGRAIDDHDINALYDVQKSFVDELSDTGQRISRWFADKPTFKSMVEVAEHTTRISSTSRQDITRGILALDDAAAFTGKNERSGTRLAQRIRADINARKLGTPEVRAKTTGEVIREAPELGPVLSGVDLLEARRIVSEQSAAANKILSSKQLGVSLPGFEPVRLDLSLRPKPDKGVVHESVINSARTALAKLSGDGRREFLRQLLLRSNSASQLASIEKGLWDDFAEFFPRMLVQATADGEIHRPLAATLGERAARMIPVKTAWTGGVGMHLPQAVYDDMAAVNSKLLNTKDFKEFGKLMHGFDWLNNRFKLGVYTLWPASLTRDGYSNIALSLLDIGLQALNPLYHRDAIKILAAGSSKAMMRRFGDDVLFGGHTVRDLVGRSKNLGVWVPGEVFAELTGDPKTAGTVLRKLSRYRGLIENEARVLLWTANMRRGATPFGAADNVAEFLFNYGEVSKTEREVFRRLIPFYTFTRKNVELQWKMLRRNPGMQINQLKPFRGRKDENEQMVQWEAEALKMRMDRDGKTVHMVTGIDLPLRNVDTLWRGDLKRTGRSIMGMVTPVMKVIPEVLLNQDFFLGRDLTRTQSNTVGRMIDTLPTPAGVKNWMGYKKEVDAAGRPSYTFDGAKFTLLFRSWMLSRAVSTSDRQFRENIDNGGVQWQRMMLDVLTGLRRKDINLDEQMDRRTRERIRQLKSVLSRRGVFDPFEVIGKPDVEGLQ